MQNQTRSSTSPHNSSHGHAQARATEDEWMRIAKEVPPEHRRALLAEAEKELARLVGLHTRAAAS